MGSLVLSTGIWLVRDGVFLSLGLWALVFGLTYFSPLLLLGGFFYRPLALWTVDSLSLLGLNSSNPWDGSLCLFVFGTTW